MGAFICEYVGKKALETQGIVKDCPIVMASADKYRQGQDHISGFVSEMVIMTGDPNDRVKKKELTLEFNSWFKESQGYRKMPKGVELYEYMDKKFGKMQKHRMARSSNFISRRGYIARSR